jgi:mannose-6-phosphate isomerase
MNDETRLTHISKCNKIDKPWGYEVLWAQTEGYVAKIMHINANQRMSLQFHQKKEETIYVMKGVLYVWENEDDEDSECYGPGTVYHVKPGMVHRFGADEMPVM